MQMMHSIRKSLWVLLFAGLAGCSGKVGGTDTGSGGSSSGTAGTTGPAGSAGAVGTGGTGTGGTGTGGTGGGLVVSTCKPGIPVSSQIPRLTKVQYANVVNELLGVMPGDDIINVLPNDSDGSLTDVGWNAYLTAADKIAAQVMGNATSKAKFISCDPNATGTAGTTCLQNTIMTFGRKAFRRPVTTDEVTSFMRFNTLTPTHTGNDVAEAILAAFLTSPTFIMVPQLAETPEGSAIKLNHFEVAAKLSLLLWNSIPDADLNAAAEGNKLGTADEVAAQAKRMLADSKAAGVAASFHHLYADISTPTSHWNTVFEHDVTKYPKFQPGSYNAAMQEMDAFFADVVKSGGTFKDLFTSPAGFVTKDLAGIYGVTSSATTPTKMALDATKRPGFLTRVGFLSTFSRYDSTSPILRGAFITGRVLNVPTGTPDPSFRNMQPPVKDYKTNREATEALTSPATCATCHALKVNPPGFVLERYDAVGGWQDTDPLGGPINSTANISFDGTTTQSISTPADLMAGIAASPNAQQFYAGMWVYFAAGRPSTLNDACVAEQLTTNLKNPSYTIASMMADFAKSDSFRLRTAGN
jgi:uncharacterized protein DUF1592/uncharacterized protein DUF1588/uncharacterized protein DUF1595/uncharacterized protein DUF1585